MLTEKSDYEINLSSNDKICISPDGQRLAIGLPYETKIQFWELPTDDEARLDFFKPKGVENRTVLLPRSDQVMQVTEHFVHFENFLTHRRDSIRLPFSGVVPLNRMFTTDELALNIVGTDSFWFFNPTLKTVKPMILKMGDLVWPSPNKQFWLMKQKAEPLFWNVFSMV